MTLLTLKLETLRDINAEQLKKRPATVVTLLVSKLERSIEVNLEQL